VQDPGLIPAYVIMAHPEVSNILDIATLGRTLLDIYVRVHPIKTTIAQTWCYEKGLTPQTVHKTVIWYRPSSSSSTSLCVYDDELLHRHVPMYR
jgi:hypothetical protein